MTLKSDTKFEEKLTCGLECQNWDFDRTLLSKVEKNV